MKQIAISRAFYNGARIRPGQEVEVPEGFVAAWCAPPAEAEKVSQERKAAKAAKTAKVDKSAVAAQALAQGAPYAKGPEGSEASDLA